MGSSKSVTDTGRVDHPYRLRPCWVPLGIAVRLDSEANDVIVRCPNFSDADDSTGGGRIENFPVAGIDTVVTIHHDYVAGTRVREPNRFAHGPLRGGVVGQRDTELSVDKENKPRTVKTRRVCATEAVGNAEVLFAHTDDFAEVKFGVRRVFEVVRRGGAVVGRIVNPGRHLSPQLRGAGCAESGMFNGERRTTRCREILRRFRGRDDFGAESVRGEGHGPDEGADQSEHGSLPRGVAVHGGANGLADSRTDNSEDPGDKSKRIADCEGRCVTDSEENVVHEISSEPEDFCLPVLWFVELCNDGVVGLCKAFLNARWRVRNISNLPSNPGAKF